jgi:hypothetical protein
MDEYSFFLDIYQKILHTNNFPSPNLLMFEEVQIKYGLRRITFDKIFLLFFQTISFIHIHDDKMLRFFNFLFIYSVSSFNIL